LIQRVCVTAQLLIKRYSLKTGKINLVIANRFLVTLEGDGVSLEDLKAYAAKFDYKKLAALQ